MKKKGIESYLKTDFIGRNIKYFDSIDSTNKKAKEIARENIEGTLVITNEQLSGKGRLGRDWVSPRGKGIWMSIILKPRVEPGEVAKITLLGAAAVHNGLKKMNINSKIKWPNDILIDDKKVCGILTEMNCELNKINYVVIGIGINVNLDDEDIPEELKGKATSIKISQGKEIDRRILVSYILEEFENLYIPFKDKGDGREGIKICRDNSSLIGKGVKVIKGKEIKLGKALDINFSGELIVEYEEGVVENISSGEVSIRGIGGYS